MAKATTELFKAFGGDTGGLGCLMQLLQEQLDLLLWEPHASFDAIKNHPRISF
jgi:hypothetical protein